MPMDDRDKDTSEDFLRTFLKRNLGYLDARIVEIQHLHRIDECKVGNRGRYSPPSELKDCQQIFLLGN